MQYNRRAMLDVIEEMKRYIGNTPVRKISVNERVVNVKLEYVNLTGSIKDRPAVYILEKAIQLGQINEQTTIVESSSGNFAIALAYLCKKLNIRLIPVIDPNISSEKEDILNLLCEEVVKVTVPDATGGYLLTRIAEVKRICGRLENCFWTDQYGNENNYLSYYHGLADELIDSIPGLGSVFVAVSSCGTITGISRKLKEYNPGIKIFAVDVEGSVIFDQPPRKRYLSGIGASQKSPLIDKAYIDEVTIVEQIDIVESCRSLFAGHLIFGGPSAGACYSAVRRALERNQIPPDSEIAFVCPDKGDSYLKTIYSEDWIKKTFYENVAELSK